MKELMKLFAETVGRYPGGNVQDELRSWAANEITTLRQQLADKALADPVTESAILRKQAEAVEAFVEPYYRTPFTRGIVMDGQEYAQRLRQQADEAERAGGENA